MSKKVPVIWTVNELKLYLNTHKRSKVMLYIGEKDKKGWNKSTSRVHMNLLWDGFVYLPVNVPDQNFSTLKAVYDIALEHKNVIGFNHTNPHKANDMMSERFGGGVEIGDILIREGSTFRIKDCNGKAGASLMLHILGVSDFSEVNLVLVGGLGASGRLIANASMAYKPKSIYIVDIKRDDKYIAGLQNLNICPVLYAHSMNELPEIEGRIGFVNATRHQNTRTGISVVDLLSGYDKKENAIVDLLMGGKKELSVLAMKHADGDEYVGWTNYELCRLVQEKTGFEPISFEEFYQKVLFSEKHRSIVTRIFSLIMNLWKC